jgi:hypothetical protein
VRTLRWGLCRRASQRGRGVRLPFGEKSASRRSLVRRGGTTRLKRTTRTRPRSSHLEQRRRERAERKGRVPRPSRHGLGSRLEGRCRALRSPYIPLQRSCRAAFEPTQTTTFLLPDPLRLLDKLLHPLLRLANDAPLPLLLPSLLPLLKPKPPTSPPVPPPPPPPTLTPLPSPPNSMTTGRPHTSTLPAVPPLLAPLSSPKSPATPVSLPSLKPSQALENPARSASLTLRRLMRTVSRGVCRGVRNRRREGELEGL